MQQARSSERTEGRPEFDAAGQSDQPLNYPHEEHTIFQDDLLLPIPPRIAQAVGMKPGAMLRATITEDGILLRWRATEDARTWRRRKKRLAQIQEEAGKEAEAARQAEGRQIFWSDEEFLASLEALVHDDADV